MQNSDSSDIREAIDSLLKTNSSADVMVSGKYALFSEPLTRSGGEKNSYPVPTYEAAKGILKSIYWKPTFIWVVEKIRVMNRIRSFPRSVKAVDWNSPASQLSVYSYLIDPCYQIRAHIEWNPLREDLAPDRNFEKHLKLARRWIGRGGRRDIFLGCRECQAYAEPCVFGEGEGCYDGAGKQDLGIMFHGYDYPSEVPGTSRLRERYSRMIMEGGVIEFDPPSSFDPAKNTEDRFVIETPVNPCRSRNFSSETKTRARNT